MSQVDIPLSNISDLEYLGNFPSPPYLLNVTILTAVTPLETANPKTEL